MTELAYIKVQKLLIIITLVNRFAADYTNILKKEYSYW